MLLMTWFKRWLSSLVSFLMCFLFPRDASSVPIDTSPVPSDTSSDLARILRITGPFDDNDPNYLLAWRSFSDVLSGDKNDREVWRDFGTEFLKNPNKARHTIGLANIIRVQRNSINQIPDYGITEMNIRNALIWVSE